MAKYAIGVDFGSLSARALVAEIGTGRELASSAMEYPHAIMDRALPDGARLKPDWALQHPQDYLDCLKAVIPRAMDRAGIHPRDVVGLGLDITACTMLPIDEAGVPLCFADEWKDDPYAYVKLWKHHAAQPQADRINALARERGEKFLDRFGGKVSSEWMLPKILETLEQNPPLYKAAHRFIEAGDWLVLMLTGNERRALGLAGYKALWNARTGYPSKSFLKALHPGLENLVEEKLNPHVYPLGSCAGGITREGAVLTGLMPGTPVAVCNIDAHVSFPSIGRAQAGDLLMVMGTSVCHIMVSRESLDVPGLSGRVEDSVIPGLVGYEANQVMGDHYNWLVDNCVPENYAGEAREKGLSLHDLLTRKAAALKVGESGLLALDWWNGNRSVLVDGQLSGLMLGMTLQTRPEELYRALVEATAFGSRMIHETMEKGGIPIENLIACGGIALKNPFVMQVYADVLGKEIRVVRSAQAPALCSAMFGAVAAGRKGGGYDSIGEASREMGGLLPVCYVPDPNRSALYDELYAEFAALHDFFGRGGNDVMKRLKAMKARVAE